MASSEQLESAATRFRPIAELGEGGMAKVHLAVARGPSGFNKLVVLKTLRSSMASDASFVEMLLHEARLAAQLNHPNVVQTYEVTVDQGLPVIVMEYLEGQPLSQVLARAKSTSPFPLMMHLSVLCDALAGLHHAHELLDFDGEKLNLVHRDVSPDNVFVTFDGQVKLLDFGIAQVASRAPGRTGTDAVKGKVRYMSPEQIEGLETDRRADIFAVGVMLWEALANDRIWTGLGDVAIMNRVVQGEIPALPSHAPETPASLERICRKALSGDASERFATAHAFQLALEEAMSAMGTGVRSRDLGLWVATAFADTRARIRAIVETEMLRAGESSPSTASKVHVLSLPRLSTRPPSRNGGDALGPATTGRSARRGALLPALAVAVAFTVVLAWTAVRRGHPAAALAPAAGTSAVATVLPAPPSAPALPATVEIAIAATPAQARLFYDDEPLSGNPVRLVRPSDEMPHSVRAIAPGYQPKTTPISLENDLNVSMSLERQSAAPPPSLGRPPVTRPVSSASAGNPPPAPKPNCSQPYYFDERGIKKIRDECL